MQAEQDAALQSLETAETICSHLLRHSSNKETVSPQHEQNEVLNGQTQRPTGPDDVRSNQHDTVSVQNQASPDATRGLAVKALLAKASVLKQLERTDEANECMRTARNLDPAVGKYIKQS